MVKNAKFIYRLGIIRGRWITHQWTDGVTSQYSFFKLLYFWDIKHIKNLFLTINKHTHQTYLWQCNSITFVFDLILLQFSVVNILFVQISSTILVRHSYFNHEFLNNENTQRLDFIIVMSTSLVNNNALTTFFLCWCIFFWESLAFDLAVFSP